MKRFAVLIIAVAMLISCAFADNTASGNAVVVYFSATGNTERVAAALSEMIGAECVEIIPAEPYTDDDLRYTDSDSRTSREDADDSARPAIEALSLDFSQYDTVFVGFPIWFGKMPKPLYTFFDSYDFAGKAIAPFCTSGNSGIAGAVRSIRELEPDAVVLEGKRVNTRSIDSDLESWLSDIRFQEEI